MYNGLFNSIFIIIIIIIIGALLIFVTMIQQETLAQKGNYSVGSNDKMNQENKSVETIAVAGLGIAGSIMSAFLTNRHNIAKDRKGREADMTRDELNLLSLIIYHLQDIAKFILLEEKNKNERVTETAKEIEDTLRDKLYLLNLNILKKWMELRTELDIGVDIDLAPRIYELIDLLTNEFNDAAIRYVEIMNIKKDLRQIPKEGLNLKLVEGFAQDSKQPRTMAAKVKVFDDFSCAGIGTAVFKGEVIEPTKTEEKVIEPTKTLYFWKTDRQGFVQIKVIADKVGKYTVNWTVYAVGYETVSLTTSFERLQHSLPKGWKTES